MKRNRLQERLDAAVWPRIYAVVIPWPQQPGEKGAYYPGTDADLYTAQEAIALMRRMSARDLTCHAFSSCDDFGLYDSAVVAEQMKHQEAR
jgi:hypothetical protein